jgi:hypothetical protein
MYMKNPAAVALGKKRWKGTTKDQRSAHMRELANTRHSKAKLDKRSQ